MLRSSQLNRAASSSIVSRARAGSGSISPRRAARQVLLVDRKNRQATAVLGHNLYEFSTSLQRSRTKDTDLEREWENTNVNVDDLEDFGDYEIILPPEPPIFGTSHITPRRVPEHILRPPYAREATKEPQNTCLNGKHSREGQTGGSMLPKERSSPRTREDGLDPFYTDPYEGDGRIEPGSSDEARLREAGSLARAVLARAKELIEIDRTTSEIDACLHELILSNNAYPSPLLYAGFPRSCCTSVNNIVVHGIPDDRKLLDGDIVNVDVTVYVNGFHGDTSQTFLVGDVDLEGRQLVQAVNEALVAGIGVCGPGVPFKAIGDAISKVADKYGLCISSQFSGHGIGKVFHRPPWILHHRNDEPGTMQPGHCFTIEPCLIQGSDPRAWIFPDGWTASTLNGARSAQSEHMVYITNTGVDVLTA